MLGHDYPALLHARRRRGPTRTGISASGIAGARRATIAKRKHGTVAPARSEAKAWHGRARAVRSGLRNMRIQAFLTAAAINLKRLAAALIVYLLHALPVALARHMVAL